MGKPLMSRIQLDTMATIVDSGSFTADYSSRTPVSGICACYFRPDSPVWHNVSSTVLP